MDLSSLNRGHPGTAPGAFHNETVETRLEFDIATGQPYYVAVPIAPRTGAVVPAPSAGPAGGLVMPHQAPRYYAPPAEGYSPVRDPFICRLVAVGTVAGGVCVGLVFALRALAAATTALGFVLAALVVLWLLAGSRSQSSRDVHVSISNHVTGRGRRR